MNEPQRTDSGEDTVETDPALPENTFLPAIAPSSYYTSFEQRGALDFLSYISWIDTSGIFIPQPPPRPVQSNEYAHTGTYSCLFSQNPWGTTDLTTTNLPIPDGASSVAVSFWVVCPYPYPDQITLTLSLDDGVPSNRTLSLTNPDPNGWCSLVVDFTLPTASRNARFWLQLNQTDRSGPIMWLDDLSITFVTETVQLLNYGVSLGGGYLAVANNAAYDFGTGNFTCEAWIKPTWIKPSEAPVFGRIDLTVGTAADAGFLFAVDSQGGLLLLVRNGDGTNYQRSFVGSTSASDGRWHHIAGVRTVDHNAQNEVSLSLYFDGKAIPSTAQGDLRSPLNINNNLRLLIGAVQPDNFLAIYQGMIAEARLWNTARSADEIANNMYLCLSGTENGLVGYWDFLHQNADDRSRTHNHGIVQGIVRFEGDQDLVEIMVGKYQAGGAPGAAWIGDHTFIAAFKGDSSEPYPRNVDVFFDASGGHEPSQPNDEADLNVVTVQGRVNDLILMSTGYPVSPQHPKKSVYAHNVQEDICGLNLTGLRQRTGMCHQVINRLLYAATWPNRSITLSNYRAGLAPRGYWLSWALFGVYGDLIVDRFNQGTHFREWCLQIGFPPPPAEAQLMQASLSFLSQDKRQQVIEHLHTVRREHSGETDEDVEAAREHLQTRLAAVLEPDEMRLMALD